MQIGAVALEELMVRQRQENIKVTRRPAADAGFALAGQPDAGAILNPLRDVDRQRAVALYASRARAGGARIFNGLPAALTARAGSLKRKKALRLPHPPGAAAHRAGFRFGAGPGAGTRAGVAGDRNRDLDLRGLAEKRFFQGDFHIVAQIRATLAPAAA